MKNKAYWQERMLNMILAGERSVLEYEKMLEEAYLQALAEIRKEIEAFYGKYAKENKISYAEARRRLDAGELKEFQALLKKWYELAKEHDMSREYMQYLKDLGQRVYLSRLESLEASVRHHIEALKANQYKSTTELLSLNYLASYYSSMFITAQGAESAVNFAVVDKLGVETAIRTRWDGRNYSDSIWADKERLVNTLHKTLPQAFSRGLNSSKIGEMIAKELNVSKNRGRALARTEVNYLANQASLSVYKTVGLEKYEFLATLDMRTSDICRSMDGFVGKVTQAQVGVNYPPMHVNCRSTTVPYFEDDDTADRIARDSSEKSIKVPRSMTQEQWIKEYAPKEQQERLLSFLKKYGSEKEK